MSENGATIDDIRQITKDYERLYALKDLEIDEKPYDLIHDWDADGYWPNAGNQGVYAIFCDNKELLYIGKASLSGSLGARLSHYFVRNRNGIGAAIRSGHHWTRAPRYVLTAAVSNPWEAPSLEEYLINKLQPADNQQKQQMPVIIPQSPDIED